MSFFLLRKIQGRKKIKIYCFLDRFDLFYKSESIGDKAITFRFTEKNARYGNHPDRVLVLNIAQRRGRAKRRTFGEDVLNETIIAVFEKVMPVHKRERISVYFLEHEPHPDFTAISISDQEAILRLFSSDKGNPSMLLQSEIALESFNRNVDVILEIEAIIDALLEARVETIFQVRISFQVV